MKSSAYKMKSISIGVLFLVFMFTCHTNFAVANEHPAETKIDSLDFKNMEIRDVLRALAQKSGINFAASQNVKGRLNIFLEDVTVIEALDIIVEMNNLAYHREPHVIKVYTTADFERKFGHDFGVQMQTESTRLLYIDTKKYCTCS